jgi:hypothetical protein
MTKLLKLSTIILNTKYIQSIYITPNKYVLRMMNHKIDGGGWRIMGTGMTTIFSHNAEIEVCEKAHPNDYKIITEWIDNQSS